MRFEITVDDFAFAAGHRLTAINQPAASILNSAAAFSSDGASSEAYPQQMRQTAARSICFEDLPLRSMSELVVGADARNASLEFGAGADNPEGTACVIAVRLC